jgi:hypothetical protein
MSSSSACTKELEIQEMSGRVSTLEQQQKSMLNMQAETLAEVRGLRADFQRYGAAISSELTRIYDAVMGEKVRPDPDVDGNGEGNAE